MQQDFEYFNPTQVIFGRQALDRLPEQLSYYGESVLLAYGGGSIHRTGLYDRVQDALRRSGKRVTDFPGIMPNPTYE